MAGCKIKVPELKNSKRLSQCDSVVQMYLCRCISDCKQEVAKFSLFVSLCKWGSFWRFCPPSWALDQPVVNNRQYMIVHGANLMTRPGSMLHQVHALLETRHVRLIRQVEGTDCETG